MKVLHIINNLSLGGAEKLLQEFVLEMKKDKRYSEVAVLIFSKENNVFDEKLLEENVKIYTSPKNKVYSIYNLFYLKNISRRYDVVHSHTFPSQLWLGVAKKIFNLNIKIVTTEHSNFNRRRKYAFFKIIDRLMYESYDSVISITEKVQKNLLDWIKKKDTSKFSVINNGINNDKFYFAKPYPINELVPNAKIDESKNNLRFVCMISRFVESKDHKTVIKSIENLDTNIHLILVGDGPTLDYVKEYVNELNLNHRVHFLGFREDIDRIIKSVDVIVLSSKWEGLSLSSLEAMAAAKPFVASDVEGLNELVKNYGELFELGNHKELSKIISKILSDEDLKNEISLKVKKRADSYSMKAMMLEYTKIYEKIME